MVLKLENIKKKMNNFIFFLILLSVLYLIANFIYLIWYIANPEGFWGFSYFWELLLVGVFAIIVIIFVSLLIAIIVSTFYKIIVGKSNFKELFKLLGIVLAVVLFSGFNYFYARGFSLYLSKKLSDKYSYLQKTEEFLKKGNLVKAFDYAKTSYNKEINRNEQSNFLFMAKFYSQTDFDKKQRLLNKYAVLINYAYCLNIDPKFNDVSESKFIEALELTKSNLLDSERKNLAIFPTLSLAEINLSRGDYLKAEKYYNELYNLNKSLENEDIFYFINCNLLFADYALRIGDINQAMKLQSENLKYYEKSKLSKTSTNYLNLLLLTATSELYFQNYEKVAELLLKAIPLAEERKDKAIYIDFLIVKANYCLASGLNSRGNELILEKNWWSKLKESFSEKSDLNTDLLKEAEKCLVELVRKSKENSGENSFEYVRNLNRLGNYYSSVGKKDLAYKALNQAQSILKPNKEKNKELYYNLLLSSVFVGIEKQNTQSILNEIESYYYNNLIDNFLFLSEDEKVFFSLNMEKKFEIINSNYLANREEKSGEKLYDNVLALKNIALYSNQNIRNYLNNLNPILRKKYQELLFEKEQLLYNNSKDAELLLNKKQRDLIVEINSQEQFKFLNPKSISWKSIRDYLRDDEVAIEIINVPENTKGKNDRRYYALIINKLYNAPKIVSLFKESELLKVLDKNGQTKERIEMLYQNESVELYQFVWKKIENETLYKKNVFLSISGTLHTVSFPAILNNKNVNLTYLGSTKDLLKNENKISNKNKISIFGDIEYGKLNETNTSKLRYTNSNFQTLPYSKKEVNQIKEKFEKKNLKEILMFTKKTATESNFRNINSTKTDIIHVATHGFYNKYGRNLDDFNDNVIENDLLKTGLVFANANKQLIDKKNDGIISSFEIAQMDLSGVDLVVLSACETGLGDIKGSEGVFGLQRAFKLAGVKSMIVSLWQVPDKSTSELMVHFYEFYLDGFSKKEALKKAQNIIKDKYKSPFYLAGFVLIE